MYRDVAFPSHIRFGLAGLLTAISLAAAPLGLPAAEPQMRGIRMHATQAKTRAEADACVARIDRANLNAVFVLVWYWGGQAYFRSDLCPMAEGVQEGFDPLGRLIEQCHQRGIEVHAWFVNGAYGSSKVRHVLDEHPDWAVDAGAAGELWYDFGKPEVRRFQSDLMIIPMAYTMDTRALGKQIDEWKTVDPDLSRIIPGLSIYERTPDGTKTRDVDLILRQRRLCLDKGARGNLFFALPYLSEPLTDALRDGPLKTDAPAYRPPAG